MRPNWDGYPPAGWRQTESWHWLQLSACHTGRPCTPRPMLWKPAEGIWTNEDLWGDRPIRLLPAEIDADYISRFCREPEGAANHDAAAVFPIAPPVAPRLHPAGTRAEPWEKPSTRGRVPLR